MTVRAIGILGLTFLTAGCARPDATADHARIIHDQIGRFSMVGSSGMYPPIVLDTATGCVMALARAENGSISIDEVSFLGGPSSCNAMKQLLVADTAHLVKP